MSNVRPRENNEAVSIERFRQGRWEVAPCALAFSARVGCNGSCFFASRGVHWVFCFACFASGAYGEAEQVRLAPSRRAVGCRSKTCRSVPVPVWCHPGWVRLFFRLLARYKASRAEQAGFQGSTLVALFTHNERCCRLPRVGLLAKARVV